MTLFPPPVLRLIPCIFFATATVSYAALTDPDALVSPVTPASTLSVTPAFVEVPVAPGSDRSFTSTLANDSDRPLTVKARWMDLALGKDGVPLPLDPGKSAVTMASWTTLSTDSVTIPPHEENTVTCRVQIPAGQTGGHYGMILFSTVQETRGSGRQAQIELRTGTLFLLTVSGALKREGKMSDKDLTVSREKSGDLDFQATLRNTGNVHLRAAGDLLIRDKAGRIVTRVKLDGGTGMILPEGSRAYMAHLAARRVSPGPYHAEVRFTSPAMPTVTSRYDFTVPK